MNFLPVSQDEEGERFEDETSDVEELDNHEKGELFKALSQHEEGERFKDETFDVEELGNHEGMATEQGLRKSSSSHCCCCWTASFGTLLCSCAVVCLGMVAVVIASSGNFVDGGSVKSNGDHYVGESSSFVVEHDSFTVVLGRYVKEVEAFAVIYQHKITKTPVMTLIPDDASQDLTFGVVFRTKPQNSHGAAHVLEHSLLSGSQKFAVKAPLATLIKSSLKTFANAMTKGDSTIFVAASRNLADFKNIMSVYFDGLFDPKVITEEGKWIFRQEAWRLEEDESGQAQFNGVVLSEMKGAMSSPDKFNIEFMKTKIFPDTSYRYNVGGDPAEIHLLSHEELIQFYKKFYHPSNAQAFLYGTKEAAEACLGKLAEYFDQYDGARLDIREDSLMEYQPPLSFKSTMEKIPYPSMRADDNHMVSFSWLVTKEARVDDNYVEHNLAPWLVLEKLLVMKPSGVIYMALRNSGLCESIVPRGIDVSTSQWTFSILVKGVHGNNTQAVKEVLTNALFDALQDGFEADEITRAMNTVEMSLRDISSGHLPRGISFFFKILNSWKHDQSPLSGYLSFEKYLSRMKKIIQSGKASQFLVDFARENLVQNRHHVTLDLYPSLEAMEAKQKNDADILEEVKNSADYEKLLKESEELVKIQEQPDSPEVLDNIPILELSDLDTVDIEYPIKVVHEENNNSIWLVSHEMVSSFGIAHIDFGIDLSSLDFDDIELLPLYSRLMIEGGTSKYSDTEVARQIGTHTGGLKQKVVIETIYPPSEDDNISYRMPNGDHFASMLFLRGSCTTDKASQFFGLVQQIMFEATLDSQTRAISILKERITILEQSVMKGGHIYARRRVRARYSASAFVQEHLDGFGALVKMRKLLEMANSDWESLHARLLKVKEALIHRDRNAMILNLTGEKAVLKSIASSVETFLNEQLLPKRDLDDAAPLERGGFYVSFAKEQQQEHPWTAEVKKRMTLESPVRDEGIVVSNPVNYVVKGGPLYHPLEEMKGSAIVVSNFLQSNLLFEELRVRRGAYGAFAYFELGVLDLSTFRDPNVIETLEVYDKAPELMIHSAENISVVSNIIGTIGQLDGSAPQPNEAGWSSLVRWMAQISGTQRQRWRDQILATQTNDFLEYATRLESWEKPTVAIIGSKAALEEAKNISLSNTSSIRLNLTLLDL